jgi:hypothetical protein
MKGWPQNDDPDSFWATPVEVAAARLANILMEERPQVIMTYNAYGFYGHPDHIQAHRITLAALQMIDYEPTLYFNAIPNSVMVLWRQRWEQEEREKIESDAAKGIVREPDVPDPDDEQVEMGTPDENIDSRSAPLTGCGLVLDEDGSRTVYENHDHRVVRSSDESEES